MSNRLDLDAIRARTEAATEGPWHRVGKSIQADVPLSDDGPSTTKWNTTVVCSVGAWGSGRPTEEDAEFIAHARTDVPALLARVALLAQRYGDLKARVLAGGWPLVVEEVEAADLREEDTRASTTSGGDRIDG